NAGHAPRATAATHPKARAGAVPVSTPSVLVNPATASTAPASPSPASPPPPQALEPASVGPFGPGGTDHGENPRYAALAVAGHPATPWYSYVSASPCFSGPVFSSGLLLD